LELIKALFFFENLTHLSWNNSLAWLHSVLT